MASATPATASAVQQWHAEPSIWELNQEYLRLSSSYNRQIRHLRSVVARVRPELLGLFDRNNRLWKEYVKSECVDTPAKLFTGGTAVPNLGLRCRIKLYAARISILQGEYAPLQH